MLKRKTSAPCSISWRKMSGSFVAGPSVQMIFVLPIAEVTIPVGRAKASWFVRQRRALRQGSLVVAAKIAALQLWSDDKKRRVLFRRAALQSKQTDAFFSLP